MLRTISTRTRMGIFLLPPAHERRTAGVIEEAATTDMTRNSIPGMTAAAGSHGPITHTGSFGMWHWRSS